MEGEPKRCIKENIFDREPECVVPVWYTNDGRWSLRWGMTKPDIFTIIWFLINSRSDWTIYYDIEINQQTGFEIINFLQHGLIW